MTDGDFTNRLPPPPVTATTATPPTGVTTPPPPASTTLDLGQARSVSLVVVRGCVCDVEGSADGQTWARLGRSTGFSAVVPARTPTFRYVRLTGPLSGLREVSVWDAAASTAPPPPAPAVTPPNPTPATAPAPGVAAPAATPPTPSPSRQVPALIALAGLLGAAIAAAATAARGRR